ncbi:MAG: YciI family protein, partial [Pseudomonadota bacterium]
MVAWNEYKAVAQERGALAFELFVAVSTPNNSIDDVKAALPDHLAYIQGLEKSGDLVMAGPLSDETGEEMQGAGMLVLRATSMENARALAANDPMHTSGARSFTLRRWLVNEGNLSVSVGLSTGVVAL